MNNIRVSNTWKNILLSAGAGILCFNSSVNAKDHSPDGTNPVFTSYTIFQPADVPANTLVNDGNAIVVGVKIRSTEPGIITAIRFYKGSGTTGTHTGLLYTSSGTLLSSATFSETASGWQEVSLPAPISISQGVTYIAACHSSSGDYAYTSAYFTTTAGSGPIKGIENGLDGGNGVYSYSASPTMPALSFNSSNYFVDAVFTPVNSATVLDGTLNFLPKLTSSSVLVNSLVYDNGTGVGVATTNVGDTAYRLFVERGIRTRKIKVDQASWPDYVFDSSYQLLPLQELRKFIIKNGHLPDMPPASEVEGQGLNLGDNQAALLRKIEELTLYLLQLDEAMNRLRKENEQLRRQANRR